MDVGVHVSCLFLLVTSYDAVSLLPCCRWLQQQQIGGGPILTPGITRGTWKGMITDILTNRPKIMQTVSWEHKHWHLTKVFLDQTIEMSCKCFLSFFVTLCPTHAIYDNLLHTLDHHQQVSVLSLKTVEFDLVGLVLSFLLQSAGSENKNTERFESCFLTSRLIKKLRSCFWHINGQSGFFLDHQSRALWSTVIHAAIHICQGSNHQGSNDS